MEEPVVLLHGLGVDHRMWALQIGPLQEVGQVWPMDLPGFGTEPPLARELRTPEAYADWVAERLRSRSVRSAHVAGYSMGGTLAVLLALRHPDLVATLALSCASPCWGRRGRRLVAEVFAGLGGLLAMEVFEWSIRRGCSRHRAEPEQRRQAADMTRRAHRPTMLRLYRELARCDLRPKLGRVRVPALVVGGARDWLAPPSHAAALAGGLTDAELMIVSGADHVLCLSHAPHLSALLCDFLRRKAATPTSGVSSGVGG